MMSLSKRLGPHLLTLLTLLGVVLGVIVGLLLRTRSTAYSEREVMYIGFVGQLFLRMLKAIILPLIIPSLIASVGGLDLGLSRRVGLRAVAYYMATTLMAVILGICLVTVLQPGHSYDDSKDEDLDGSVSGKRNVTTADTLMDLVRNAFPPNLVQATFQQYRTSIIYNGDSEDKSLWPIEGEYVMATNILGLIVFSLVAGVAIAGAGDDGKPLLNFFHSMFVVMMRVTSWVIALAPVGVFFLVTGQIVSMKEDVAAIFAKLGWYFLTALLGLLIHGFITLPTVFFLTTRRLPFRFIANMGTALTTAFGTSSSSATLPVTLECLEHKNHVDPRIAQFVLPIGATINMDGTALYEAVAAIFIAQVRNVPLSLGNVLAISLTATAASIGAAGIPQAGLVTMVMVLDTVGLPADDVALILAVDWLLDRFRTAINVLGDSLGAGLIHHLSKGELDDNFSSEETQLKQHTSYKDVEKNGYQSNNGAFENDTAM